MKRKEYILILILLLVVFGLTRWFYKQDESAAPYITGNEQPEHLGLTTIPPSLAEAFKKLEIEVDHIIAFDGEKVFVYKGENRIAKPLDFPIDVTALVSQTNISVTQLIGSRCTLIIIDGKKEYDCGNHIEID